VRQRDELEQRFTEMHYEVERIARELLEGMPASAILHQADTDSDAPATIPLDRAA
jgi:hypothetical protein